MNCQKRQLAFSLFFKNNWKELKWVIKDSFRGDGGRALARHRYAPRSSISKEVKVIVVRTSALALRHSAAYSVAYSVDLMQLPAGAGEASPLGHHHPAFIEPLGHHYLGTIRKRSLNGAQSCVACAKLNGFPMVCAKSQAARPQNNISIWCCL